MPDSPSSRWAPHVTVAAVIEQDGRYLLVEEHTAEGLRCNNPAGHLEPGESLVQACAREVLEETCHVFRPEAVVGIYLARLGSPAEAITYLRFAFCGTLGPQEVGRMPDTGIVRSVWMTAVEVFANSTAMRSPLVAASIRDHARGQRYSLDVLHTAASALWTDRAL